MNINQLMKQAQQMQRKAEKIQEELKNKEYPFSVQNDAIKGVMNGDMEIVSLSVNPDLAKDLTMLEDLMMIAVNQTVREIQKDKEKAMTSLTGGMNMPGLF